MKEHHAFNLTFGLWILWWLGPSPRQEWQQVLEDSALWLTQMLKHGPFLKSQKWSDPGRMILWVEGVVHLRNFMSGQRYTATCYNDLQLRLPSLTHTHRCSCLTCSAHLSTVFFLSSLTLKRTFLNQAACLKWQRNISESIKGWRWENNDKCLSWAMHLSKVGMAAIWREWCSQSAGSCGWQYGFYRALIAGLYITADGDGPELDSFLLGARTPDWSALKICRKANTVPFYICLLYEW